MATTAKDLVVTVSGNPSEFQRALAELQASLEMMCATIVQPMGDMADAIQYVADQMQHPDAITVTYREVHDLKWKELAGE